MDEKTLDEIVQKGIELAETWMRETVKTAPNSRAVQARMMSLEVAAKIVIATCAFNYELQSGVPLEDYLAKLEATITTEVEELRSQEEMGGVETLTPRSELH